MVLMPRGYIFENWLINREPLIVVDHGLGDNVTHSNIPAWNRNGLASRESHLGLSSEQSVIP
jgi:hypothetical protein